MPNVARLEVGAEPIPGYRLREHLGRGGFGEVWRAEDPKGTAIALKFLPCDRSVGAGEENRAVQLVRQLRHANLVHIDQIWCNPGYLILAMELADGNLFDLFDAYEAEFHTPIAAELLCFLLGQAAEALDFLNSRQHNLGGRCVALQHGDVNPRNLLLFGETVKLGDFSLTSVLTAAQPAHCAGGTPDFAAPEVFLGRFSDRTDQYALAVTYCVLRSGRLPFPDTPRKLPRNYIRPPPDLTMLSEAEAAVVAQALSPMPMDRWKSCGELMSRLEHAVNGGRKAPQAHPGKNKSAHPAQHAQKDDRRARVRRPCSLNTSGRLFGAAAENPWTARIEDISCGGIGLVLDCELKPGTLLAVKLEDAGERFSRPLIVRVVRVRERSDHEWLMGCSFVRNLDENEVQALLA